VRIAFTVVGVSALIKYLTFTAMLLLGANALSAASFDFSFSGPGVTATGELTATLSGGTYHVSSITGTQNGATISGGSGSSFTLLGSSFSNASLQFTVPNGSEIVRSTIGLWEIGAGPGGVTSLITHSSVTAVPEPAVLLLLLTMGLGVWLFGRKVLSKSTP
jgi:hypothetical protein